MRLLALALLAAAVMPLAMVSMAPCAQGILVEEPYLDDFHSPLSRKPYVNPLRLPTATVLKVDTKLFAPHEDIDFEKRQLTFSKVDKLGFEFWVYHYGELGDYLFGAMRFSLFDGWFTEIARSRQAKTEQAVRTALDFALPIQYPKWAQRILGKEPPKLSIDGHLTLTVSYDSYRTELNDVVKSEDNGINFNQENSFTIRGSIGRVINISISAGSQEEFNFENQLKNFKIEYKDDNNELEDEVIQEIVAGYTGFAMPGQGLAGYSESHEGLFGIKVRSKIGPLMLTTIASNEQGEAQKLTVSSGSSAGGMTVHRDRDYLKYRYFFLDSVYLKHYLRKAAGADTGSGPPRVVYEELWLAVDQAEIAAQKANNVIYRKANTAAGPLTFRKIESYAYKSDRELGWVRLDSVNINEDDIIAMFLVTQAKVLGDTTVVGNVQSLDIMDSLVILKSANPDPSDPSFDLAWRNVYTAPRNISDRSFTLTVKSVADSQDGPGGAKLYSQILGLTNASDGTKPLIERTDIYDRDGFLIIPPFADSVIGNQSFRNPALGDSVIDIYTQNYGEYSRNHLDKYIITMSGGTDEKKTAIDMGFGVMSGTEKVKGDGVLYTRDVDYVVNYEMGSLELVSPRARAANRVEVEYQREALFIPEDKVFLGVHGQMNLPFISEKSFIGATVMWQNVTSNEKVPRIGQEPYSRLLLDFNTSLEFEPEWMTKLINWIPLVETEAPSKADFSFEVARSKVDPNSKRKAFVDDFEAAKQVLSPSMGYQSWRKASPPFDLLLTDTMATAATGDSALVSRMLFHPPAWETWWFNPVDKDESNAVRRTVIYDLKDADKLTSSEQYERVLTLKANPAPPATNPALSQLHRQYVSPWTGIMTSIPASFSDREDDKYLEFVAKSSGGGVLSIDFGVISEDVSIEGGVPNGTDPNSEDTLYKFTADATLDLGLDGRKDEDEFYVVPNTDSLKWDTLRVTTPPNVLLPRPSDPAYDNWGRYSSDAYGEPRERQVSGLQGNGGTLNSEDMNLDGDFVTRGDERFFRVSIDLDSVENLPPDTASIRDGLLDTLFIDLSSNVRHPNGWHLFRIPIHDTLRIDTMSASSKKPAMREIRAIRLYWTGFDSAKASNEKTLMVTGMQFVGNQWRELPTVQADSSKVMKVEASTVNSVDNPNYYTMLDTNAAPITIDRDSRTKTIKREQSLRLIYTDVRPGEEAMVERRFTYQSFDLSNYDSLTMLVYSGEDRSADRMRFVFRFGADSLSYYEYRTGYLQRVNDNGWSANAINILLRDFMDLKLRFLDNHNSDSVMVADTMSADGRHRIVSRNGRMPSFSQITWMSMGLQREQPGAATGVSGEVYVNEMKVTGNRELVGWAARLAFNTTWADFMDFSVSADYNDADFRTMTDEINRSGTSSLRGTMNGNIKLDKFLPSDWGVSIPLGGTLGGSISRPLKKPNTDIDLSEDGQSDRLDDMFSDAIALVTGFNVGDGYKDVTRAERYQSTQRNRTWYTKYDKAMKSDHKLVNLTAERIKVDYTYRQDLSTIGRGKARIGEATVVDTTLTTTRAGKLSYDLTPRTPPKWSKWKPFDKVKSSWLPAPLKGYELSLLPKTLTFSLADVQYVDRYAVTTVATSSVPRYDVSRSLSLGHGLTVNYDPISPLLSLSYTLSVNRELDSAVARVYSGEADSWWDGVVNDGVFAWHRDPAWSEYHLLYGERNRRQSLGVGIKPKFFDWLSHDFDYKADYGSQLSRIQNDSRDYYDLTVGSSFNFRSSFELTALFRALSDRTKKVKWLSKGLGGVEKALDKISLRSIAFDYDARSDLQNRKVGTGYLDRAGSGTDFAAYKIGKEGRSLWDMMTGNMDDEEYGGMRNRASHGDEFSRYRDDLRSATQRWSLSTSLNVPDPIGLNINPMKLTWERKYSVKPDTLWVDTSITWPTLTLGASLSVLNKLAVVKKLMTNLKVSTAYSYDQMVARRGTATLDAEGNRVLPRKETTTGHKWEPLVKVDGTFKKFAINFRYEHRYSNDLQEGQTLTKTKKNSDNAGVDYEFKKSGKDRSLKILRWKIPIKGRLTMGLTGDRSHEIVWQNMERDVDLDNEATATTDITEYSVKPNIRYQFTESVDGTFEYSYTFREVQPAAEKTYNHKAALIIAIRF